jgi:hypothetical protein
LAPYPEDEMIDLILLLLVIMIFLAGVQVGAIWGGIGALMRKLGDYIDSKWGKKNGEH